MRRDYRNGAGLPALTTPCPRAAPPALPPADGRSRHSLTEESSTQTRRRPDRWQRRLPSWHASQLQRRREEPRPANDGALTTAASRQLANPHSCSSTGILTTPQRTSHPASLTLSISPPSSRFLACGLTCSASRTRTATALGGDVVRNGSWIGVCCRFVVHQ